jgi:hypothetical protein
VGSRGAGPRTALEELASWGGPETGGRRRWTIGYLSRPVHAHEWGCSLPCEPEDTWDAPRAADRASKRSSSQFPVAVATTLRPQPRELRE